MDLLFVDHGQCVHLVLCMPLPPSTLNKGDGGRTLAEGPVTHTVRS